MQNVFNYGNARWAIRYLRAAKPHRREMWRELELPNQFERVLIIKAARPPPIPKLIDIIQIVSGYMNLKPLPLRKASQLYEQNGDPPVIITGSSTVMPGPADAHCDRARQLTGSCDSHGVVKLP